MINFNLQVSDHEAGGFAIGKDVGLKYSGYKPFPEIVKNANASAYNLAQIIMDKSSSEKEIKDFIEKYWKLNDLSAEELKKIHENKELYDSATGYAKVDQVYNLTAVLGNIISPRARLGVA